MDPTTQPQSPRPNLVLAVSPRGTSSGTLGFAQRMAQPLRYAHSPRAHRRLRVLASVTALLLLPPFVVLAVAPMLLLLVPVAMVGVPFLIPALMSGSFASLLADQQRASALPLARPTLVYR